MLRGEGGQESLDAPEAFADVVADLLLPCDEGELVVQGLAGLAGQVVGLLLAADQAAHRLGPFPGQLADHMALVEGVLGIAGEEKADVRGEAGGALVLLPGQPARRAPAVVQGEPGQGERVLQPFGLGALPRQLFLGGVVRLGGLLRLPVQALKVRQQLGQGAVAGLGGVRYGSRGQRGEDGSGRHRRRRGRTYET
ncbi:hypothetical protein SALBM311S_11587 [Streptomyces alboniger]